MLKNKLLSLQDPLCHPYPISTECLWISFILFFISYLFCYSSGGKCERCHCHDTTNCSILKSLNGNV